MNSRKNVRGQGMSEYLIIVALIAVAGIAVMGLFGGAARNQVAGLAMEISGQDGQQSITDSQEDADNAATDGTTNKNLSSYNGGNTTIGGND